MGHTPFPLSFTLDEVEARGTKPWTEQRKFDQEIDTESMETSAAAYARASAEARSVDDLARRATELSKNAGSLNGASLVKDGRYDETHRALQRGGDDMDAVVRHIIRGMNRALDARENNRKHIGWMDARLEAHRSAAANEWNALNKALYHANLHVGQPEDPTVTITYGGKPLTVPRQGLPVWLANQIREKHLKNAVSDAAWAHQQIQDEINYYRHQMLNEARQLAELGYDLGDGPFKLFLTPQMARYAASRLKSELNEDHPDPQRVEFYTHALRAIAESVYDDPVRGGPPDGRLSGAERAYLQTFFGTLDAASLAKLGTLDGADVINAKRNVANGIQMLMNPEIGGIDPRNTSNVPAAIRAFVYDYRDGALSDPSNSSAFRTELEKLNGFGGVMSYASVASGTRFSEDLARAALNIEIQAGAHERIGGFSAPNHPPQVLNTASSGMLEAAALNTLASANLLGDARFRGDLLSQGWDDSTGAAALVKSGTTLPEGVDPRSELGRRYAKAAEGVLTYVGDHGTSLVPTVGYADLSDLQREVGDAAIRNMTTLASDVNTGGGQFAFSADQRKSLFAYMNAADTEVRDGFFRDVGTWQYRTALAAFREGEPHLGIPMYRIGAVQGTIADVQNRTDDMATAAGTINGLGTLATAVPHPVPQSSGALIAALAALAGANLPSEIEQGDVDGRVAIMMAALNSGHISEAEKDALTRYAHNPQALATQITGMQKMAGAELKFHEAFEKYRGG